MDQPSRGILPIVGSIAFLFAAPGLLGVFIPWYTTGWRMEAPLLGFEPARWLGGALILVGATVLLDSFARFAWQGRGTPAPIYPTTTLVVSGAYRYVRNPMYLAVMALIAGQGLLLGILPVLIYALAFGVVTHLFVLVYEEPTLRSAFGAQYEAYAAEVRRWLPRLTPWRGAVSSRPTPPA
ncbi:methyltransferase family protein [Microvirga zambiensis]|uniref:methyltransferase family protein n=1 Tax=Microvirga zambiensis TaxID=1402137 RepID=UPI00191D8FAC|nr:isoprenylcysteine carboxylmethyltransferase family protein [Microvirga zambiensis]